MKNTILIGTSVHRWDDPRILYKESISLGKYFNNVELHCPGNFKTKVVQGVRIYGLGAWDKESDRLILMWNLWKNLKKRKPEVFHFHDPELIIIGLLYKLLFKKKVIYDIHENTGDMIFQKKWIPALFKPFFYLGYKILEKISTLYLDKLIIAEINYKKFIKKNATTILNYPLLEDSNRNIIQIRAEQKNVNILYIGAIDIYRGILESIEAMSYITKVNKFIKLVIVGPIKHKWLRKKITYLISKLSLEDIVIIEGSKNYTQLPHYYEEATVGLALLSPLKNYTESIPTKFFDYMKFGLPIVGSNFDLWSKFINRYKCGITVDQSNPNDISENILKLVSNKELLNELGKNGVYYVKKKFNWDSQEKKLINLYNSIL